jgi:hypothetical protein
MLRGKIGEAGPGQKKIKKIKKRVDRPSGLWYFAPVRHFLTGIPNTTSRVERRRFV